MSAKGEKQIDANESVDHVVEEFRRVADELTEHVVAGLNELADMHLELLAKVREWEQEEEN